MGDKLEGKTAVVTGGGSDIGLATARRFVLLAQKNSVNKHNGSIVCPSP